MCAYLEIFHFESRFVSVLRWYYRRLQNWVPLAWHCNLQYWRLAWLRFLQTIVVFPRESTLIKCRPSHSYETIRTAFWNIHHKNHLNISNLPLALVFTFKFHRFSLQHYFWTAVLHIHTCIKFPSDIFLILPTFCIL